MTNIEQFTQQLMLSHNIDYWTALSRAELFYKKLDTDRPDILCEATSWQPLPSPPKDK